MDLKYKIIVLLILFQTMVSAQNDADKKMQQRDSLYLKLKADSTHIYRFQQFRPYVNLDQRYSFIKKAPININGLQAGVLINEKHVVGLGGYMITSISKQKTRTDNIEENRELDLKYGTLFYQYVTIDRRFLELDLQGESGAGKYNLIISDANTNITILRKSAAMFVSGLGPILTIKPFKWIGISGMAGYRFSFDKNPNLNFSGAYYGYGAWLDVRQIIRDIHYYGITKRRYKRQLLEYSG